MLSKRGVKLCIADQNLSGAQATASKVGNGSIAVQVSVTDWDSQVAAFQKAVDEFGRIDYVYPIAGVGERKTVKNDPKATKGFEKPDLTTLDVDLTGVLFTAYLGIQQMRRQEKDESGFRGRSKKSELVRVAVCNTDIFLVAATASMCGFYCVPSKYNRAMFGACLY